MDDRRRAYIQERQDEGATPNTITQYARFFSLIEKAEETTGISIENGLTADEFRTLFQATGATKKQTFRGYKSRIVTYLDWLKGKGYDVGNLGEIKKIAYSSLNLDNQIKRNYFKDFGSLQKAIEQVVEYSEVPDEDIFQTTISLIYLAWCGLTKEEACGLLKSDVLEDRILVDGREVFPNKTIMDYLHKYIETDGYNSEGESSSLRFLYYRRTQYLIRTIKSEYLQTERISYRFVDFTKIPEKNGFEIDKEFAYYNIYWSGVFNRAYRWELENGEIQRNDIDTINKVLGVNETVTSTANLSLDNYLAYKQLYFG